MKLSHGLFVLFLSLPLFDAAQFRSDYQHSPEARGWLKIHRIPATWHDARFRCLLEGAFLASPTNIHLLTAMTELINTTSPSRTVFTGIHATYSKGDYFSLEGVPLSKIPTSWAPNEPDNHADSEECLVLHSDGTIADVQCGDTYSYICYKKKTHDMPAVSECGTIDSGYRLETRTGSCYKFHSEARTWSGAFMTCAAEGGHMAIANSATEAQIFKELYQEIQLNGTSGHEIVSLGFRLEDQKYWFTIHGETLEEAGYSDWAGHEPNTKRNPENDFEGENCGAIDMESLSIGLRNIWCGNQNPFICEKDPKSLAEATEVSTTATPNNNYLSNVVPQLRGMIANELNENEFEEIKQSSTTHSL